MRLVARIIRAPTIQEPTLSKGANKSAAAHPQPGKRRRALRAAGHSLNPVVTIGAAGVTAGVLAETDRALDDHELIKIKVALDEREDRREAVGRLCEELGAELVQSIGKVALVYREHVDED